MRATATTQPPMDDMLAAHRGNIAPYLVKARTEVADLTQMLQDAIEAPEVVNAAAFAAMLRAHATELEWLAANVDAGIPEEARQGT